jgi:replication factor A1
MEIKDLKPKTGNINLELEIISKEEPREFNKFGKAGRVCNATGKDDTGEIKITLWNEQIDQINTGDKVSFENAYVNEWQGQLQLSTGKFGTFKII